MHSQKSPACETDWANLFSFANNELGHITQQAPGSEPLNKISQVFFFIFAKAINPFAVHILALVF